MFRLFPLKAAFFLSAKFNIRGNKSYTLYFSVNSRNASSRIVYLPGQDGVETADHDVGEDRLAEQFGGRRLSGRDPAA